MPRYKLPEPLIEAVTAALPAEVQDPQATARAVLDAVAEAFQDHDVAYQTVRTMDAGNHLWVSGFKTVDPTDEFAAQIGHDVIAHLVRSGKMRTLMTFNAT